jgi:hypothetical protein
MGARATLIVSMPSKALIAVQNASTKRWGTFLLPGLTVQPSVSLPTLVPSSVFLLPSGRKEEMQDSVIPWHYVIKLGDGKGSGS